MSPLVWRTTSDGLEATHGSWRLTVARCVVGWEWALHPPGGEGRGSVATSEAEAKEAVEAALWTELHIPWGDC